jgi:GT2 family glycosyltransferase
MNESGKPGSTSGGHLPSSSPGTNGSCDAVIVNYNAGRFLAESVRQLQASPVIGRIVIVDNDSRDDSLSLLPDDSGDSRLVVIRNQANLGFAAASNIGLRASVSPFAMLVNPDCFVSPKAIDAMIATLRAHPKAGMVGPQILNPDGSEQAGARRSDPTPWRSFVRAFGLSRFFKDFGLEKETLPTAATDVDAISGACMLVTRDALKTVGLLDEGYFMHCEDLDWCRRFRLAGFAVLFDPSAVVTHEKGVSSKPRPVFVEWHKHRGMVRYYRKFFRDDYPLPLMWAVIVTVWLRFGVVAVVKTARRLAGM